MLVCVRWYCVYPLSLRNVEEMIACKWRGSDWPYTGPFPGRPRERDAVDPFHPVDNGAQLSMLGRWTKDAERQQLLTENPARLYGF